MVEPISAEVNTKDKPASHRGPLVAVVKTGNNALTHRRRRTMDRLSIGTKRAHRAEGMSSSLMRNAADTLVNNASPT